MTTGEGPVQPPADGFGIEELARRTGMSVRNIRAHRSRGLLPSPRRVGRAAVYDDHHVERIRHIQDLQQRGFNLAAIGALLAARSLEGDAEELLRLALAPLLRHEPLVVDRAELAARFGYVSPDEELLQHAVDHGLARDVGDGRVEVASAQLASAGLALVQLGLSASDVLRLETTFIEATRAAATQFVEQCRRHAWDPFAAAGYPAESWPSVAATFQRLVEQVSVVLMATFSLELRAAAEVSLRTGLQADPSSRDG